MLYCWWLQAVTNGKLCLTLQFLLLLALVPHANAAGPWGAAKTAPLGWSGWKHGVNVKHTPPTIAQRGCNPTSASQGSSLLPWMWRQLLGPSLPLEDTWASRQQCKTLAPLIPHLSLLWVCSWLFARQKFSNVWLIRRSSVSLCIDSVWGF